MALNDEFENHVQFLFTDAREQIVLDKTPYGLLDFVKAGGEGRVYKGITQENQRIAVKELHEVPSGAALSTLEKQLGLWKDKLNNSSSIPKLIAHGKTETGIPRYFIITDWIDGVTLEQKIAERKFTQDEALAFASRALEGLARFHAAEILHRDISPANIMLTANNEVVYTDLGTIRDAEVGQLGATMQTSQKVTLGYVASEVIMGTLTSKSYASDLYSIGGLLWYSLLGEHPQTQFYVPLGTSALNFAKLEALHLDPRFVQLIKKLREEDSNNRYQTTAAVQEDLAKIQSESHLPAPPQSAHYSLAKSVGRWVSDTTIALFYRKRGILKNSDESIDTIYEARWRELNRQLWVAGGVQNPLILNAQGKRMYVFDPKIADVYKKYAFDSIDFPEVLRKRTLNALELQPFFIDGKNYIPLRVYSLNMGERIILVGRDGTMLDQIKIGRHTTLHSLPLHFNNRDWLLLSSVISGTNPVPKNLVNSDGEKWGRPETPGWVSIGEHSLRYNDTDYLLVTQIYDKGNKAYYMGERGEVLLEATDLGKPVRIGQEEKYWVPFTSEDKINNKGYLRVGPDGTELFAKRLFSEATALASEAGSFIFGKFQEKSGVNYAAVFTEKGIFGKPYFASETIDSQNDGSWTFGLPQIHIWNGKRYALLTWNLLGGRRKQALAASDGSLLGDKRNWESITFISKKNTSEKEYALCRITDPQGNIDLPVVYDNENHALFGTTTKINSTNHKRFYKWYSSLGDLEVMCFEERFMTDLTQVVRDKNGNTFYKNPNEDELISSISEEGFVFDTSVVRVLQFHNFVMARYELRTQEGKTLLSEQGTFLSWERVDENKVKIEYQNGIKGHRIINLRERI